MSVLVVVGGEVAGSAQDGSGRTDVETTRSSGDAAPESGRTQVGQGARGPGQVVRRFVRAFSTERIMCDSVFPKSASRVST
jgi:hypothetical protein